MGPHFIWLIASPSSSALLKTGKRHVGKFLEREEEEWDAEISP